MFFRRTKRDIIDEQLGLRVTREGKYIRAVIGDRSMLFAAASPEQFVRDYRASFDVIELACGGVAHGGRMLQFLPAERDELRRDIALHWIRYYLSTNQQVQIQPKDLNHPQTWAIVLQKAEAKYGSRSEDAMALAAHTVGADLHEFARWRRVEDDRVANM